MPNRSAAAASLCAAVCAALLAACAADGPPAAAASGASAGTELPLTLLHTSDEHSTLLPEPFVAYAPEGGGEARGGFARLAGVVEQIRTRKAELGEPVLLTSAGDNVGGSPFAWLILAGEAPELTLMRELGYDVITLGNHEFDYGSDRLADYLAAAGLPEATRPVLVATNTLPPAGHALGRRGLRHTHISTLANGVRVGWFGLLGSAAARFTTLAPPVTFGDPHEAAAAAVEELRAAGVHLVVAITHAGLDEDRALAAAVPGIDVILGGHDHLLLDEPVREGATLIVHAGEYLHQLVQLELAVDTARGSVRVRNAETGTPYVVPLDGRAPESAWMAARVAHYRDRLDARVAELTGRRYTGIGETVVLSDFTLPAGPPLTETGLGNFVTDAMRVAVEAATGERVDVAFQANGVIRGDLVAGGAAWNRGRITAYDLAGVFGMGVGPDGLPGYPLVSVYLTGREVRRVMELSVLLSELLGNSYYLQPSGLRAEYAPRRAVLARIPIRGTPIPTGRAVLAIDRIDDDARLPIARDDTTLLHVVTDRYVASFLPTVGRLVPRLAIVPKTADGTPIVDIDDAIVYRDDRELKVWHAVFEFAAAQPVGADGYPRIRSDYASPAGRLVGTTAPPLWLWPALAGTLVLAGGGAIVARQRRRRRT